MKKVGYLISHKNNERRRALLPPDAAKIEHCSQLVIESGYGEAHGYSDADYLNTGASVANRRTVLGCDVLVDVKLGDAEYIRDLAPGKTLVGWAHVEQKLAFTDAAIDGGHTIVAWEDLYEKGRYLFYRNRELAGETAILHAFTQYGRMPYDCRVAIIGNGMTAHGAHRILSGLGARVDIFTRKLEPLFRQRMGDYDVLVNCVLWDTKRTDRLIYREDLLRLKRGAMIIDVSCDPCMEIETSHPTTIDNPVYTVDGVLHYAVDNAPAMAYRTVTELISRAFSPYVDCLVTGAHNIALEAAVAIRAGEVTNPSILAFHTRRKCIEELLEA
ncbi:MAG TPA: N(5)-(carboxyethyl)ornithine synthase [Candidatus Cryosericum sp.]|nr:N(5)-(carboxyethyl)ornithine synthase [Candidatus Cryosericum sp.]